MIEMLILLMTVTVALMSVIVWRLWGVRCWQKGELDKSERFVADAIGRHIDLLAICICCVSLLSSCKDYTDTCCYEPMFPREQDSPGHGSQVPDSTGCDSLGIPADARTLVAVLDSGAYSPEEFIDQLGAPSLDMIYEMISPNLKDITKGLGKSKMMSHLPQLDSLFISEVGSSDGFLDETSSKTQALFELLDKEWNLDGWKPQTPIYFAHALKDELFPYDLVHGAIAFR